MLSIGEFSKATGLSVKTLHFYHEKGILVPSVVDARSGYRYFDRQNLEKARIIVRLRTMQFSLNEIQEILGNYDDEADILEYLERHKRLIEDKMRRFGDIATILARIIQNEREARDAMNSSVFEVEEKAVESVLIAGVRMKGRYSDCSKGFARIGRRLGRYVCGNPFLLHYDTEYREDDADFEACMPISKKVEAEGVSVRELPGGRCISLLHKGPYDELGRSYAKILEYIRDEGYEMTVPSREVYIKGPGMILKGNPRNYLTEIQMIVDGPKPA